ncbi:hypothetical protein EB230_21030 [Mesorhizobium sp. NZP2234]|nr:hypothetical protein EB230_21030 [Mesorhizobium sp. NZP2234]
MLVGIILIVTQVATGHVAKYSPVDYGNTAAYDKCVKDNSKSYCSCVVDASKALEDNEEILNIFLSAKEVDTSVKMVQELIDSDKYNSHVFSSRKDKSEFIRGKLALFLSEVKRKCD